MSHCELPPVSSAFFSSSSCLRRGEGRGHRGGEQKVLVAGQAWSRGQVGREALGRMRIGRQEREGRGLGRQDRKVDRGELLPASFFFS